MLNCSEQQEENRKRADTDISLKSAKQIYYLSLHFPGCGNCTLLLLSSTNQTEVTRHQKFP
ncbi:hypothetical protein T4B_12808 [Trichinella pseudospiralis]|uniref:Uncharacterized protein n=2 Tax=Trichinella pseudospiralis TaxID=6337 RepID=A0A0V1IHC6_TRIPS|nr:hypothetical protein T4D_5983 [Trichinella pseudospiralis]KRZ22166.1 hypothetical protein T4B_12808 [Trichinella pseudospiralis]